MHVTICAGDIWRVTVRVLGELHEFTTQGSRYLNHVCGDSLSPCANTEGLGQGVDIGVIQPTGFYGDA